MYILAPKCKSLAVDNTFYRNMFSDKIGLNISRESSACRGFT